jgi:hypothetical protein
VPRTRDLTIIAQDPSIPGPDGEILTTQVRVPAEKLGPGPLGYRVHVVAYDASQRVLYEPAELGDEGDLFKGVGDHTLLGTPAFHAQNVYAIVMRLLARFEAALGRRISWGFNGHQLHVSPHAFAEDNAFYSDDARSLLFGYFTGQEGQTVFSCLSHDIVAHETTHALLDGLRSNYTLPSGPDQAGFHEGFADISALLSVFGLRDVVEALLLRSEGKVDAAVEPGEGPRISKKALTIEGLKSSALLGLAEQFGQEASGFRDDVLRRSVARPPTSTAYTDPSFDESHKRGEIVASAVLNSFVAAWRKRLESWLPVKDETVKIDRVAEDGADAADQLLTMAIRALDYCPPVDLSFGDFLSALLTADYELLPGDGKYQYRKLLREQFRRWGIPPASTGEDPDDHGPVPEEGAWGSARERGQLTYDNVHREALQRDPDEVFRFIWENRGPLRIYPDAYTHVESVRPCVRVGPDGFVLHETVAEYLQSLDLEAKELHGMGIDKPADMPDTTQIRLNGGGALVFDEYGHLKYHVRKRLDDRVRQAGMLAYLWRYKIRDRDGRYGFTDGAKRGLRFAMMHLRRAGRLREDEWDD